MHGRVNFIAALKLNLRRNIDRDLPRDFIVDTEKLSHFHVTLLGLIGNVPQLHNRLFPLLRIRATVK